MFVCLLVCLFLCSVLFLLCFVIHQSHILGSLQKVQQINKIVFCFIEVDRKYTTGCSAMGFKVLLISEDETFESVVDILRGLGGGVRE